MRRACFAQTSSRWGGSTQTPLSLESDTKASEASAQKEYDGFTTDSKVDKASKSADIEHKTAKRQDESQALTTKREDLEGTQKELDAALAYFDKQALVR